MIMIIGPFFFNFLKILIHSGNKENAKKIVPSLPYKIVKYINFINM